MTNEIEIRVGDVNDVEARVIAQLHGARPSDAEAGQPVAISGVVRGPYCDQTRTLPAEFVFRDSGLGRAEAVIPDPCAWSPELPHMYQVQIEARRGERVVAQYQGSIGLRRGAKIGPSEPE
jgi:hypothetical protein